MLRVQRLRFTYFPTTMSSDQYLLQLVIESYGFIQSSKLTVDIKLVSLNFNIQQPPKTNVGIIHQRK